MADPPFNPFSIDWNSCSTGRWDRMLAQCRKPNLLQTWQYGAALFATERVKIDSGVIHFHQKPIGIVQVEVRPLLWLFRHCAIWRGPLWIHDEIPPRMQVLVLNMLRRRYNPLNGAWLSFNPELVDTPEHRAQMRDAGFTYRARGYSSIWLDLRPEADDLRAGLHQNWRNALVQAERAGLEFTIDRDGRNLSWLLDTYESDKAEKGYRGPSPALIRTLHKAFGERQAMWILQARHEGQPIAAVLFVRHGTSATYLIGWNGEEGRRLRAHNLLLWQGLLALKADGTDWLDLGGVNDADAAGVALFKRGLGGEEFTLVGGYA